MSNMQPGVRFKTSDKRFCADERKGNGTKLEESRIHAKSAVMVSENRTKIGRFWVILGDMGIGIFRHFV